MSEFDTANLRAMRRQQATLARFGELALRSNELDEILTEACRLAGEALGTHLAKVVELQADGKTLLVRAGVGWLPGVVGVATIMAEDNTSEGHAIRTGEPMISPDIVKETRFTYPKFLRDNGVKAVANVLIIRSHGRPPFGILQIDSQVPREFTESDTFFLRSYANLLAAAVDRIEIVDHARKVERGLRAALEERVAERTRALTEANTRLKAEALERGRAEEALRQSHKMEAIGQLTGGLAHDFNNLLGVIVGNLELARLRLTDGRATELARYIEPAITSAKRAAALTHRLLAFSRQQTLDPRPIDVNTLILGMEPIFQDTVGPAIHVDRIGGADLWPTLCDANQLENALLNLIINARDAMPDGGRLTIETKNKSNSEIDQSIPSGDHVMIVLSDTGAGMPAEVAARAFDPFFTTKAVGKGTGLGLSMVYGFVQQSGGQVVLNSTPGLGTTVVICLPRYDGIVIEPARNTVAETEFAADSAVVLVVEDEPEMRALVADVLSGVGYTVLEAADGRSGLRIVDSDIRIDLLVTDVGLPNGMNGRQLADATRERRPGLKVLLMTGYAESAAVGNGLMDEGMEVMTKPFALEAFAAKISTMIRGGSH